MDTLSKEEYKAARKGYYRCRALFALGRSCLGGWFLRKNDFHGEKLHLTEEPFLFIANHADNNDPGYELMMVGKYIRYIVSDHLMRKGLLTAVLRFVAAPIVKHRDHNSDALVAQVQQSIRAGINVAIHVEGGKSNNGETGYISPRTAQMVKDCDCAVVTYRLVGGYMRTPRWADNKRKGPLFGKPVRIYSKEEISAMTVEEVYRMICKDLYVNAYEEQRKNPHMYLAEHPAQSAEIVLYACPQCKSIGTLHSKGDTLSCSCGFAAVIDDYGFWHSPAMAFDTIVEWDAFQKEVLAAHVRQCVADGTALFSDAGQRIALVYGSEKRPFAENALVTLYPDCLVFAFDGQTHSVPVAEIHRVDTVSKMTLLVVAGDTYYEIHSGHPRSATKYVHAVRNLQGKENL